MTHYFMTALRKRDTTGLLGSFEKTWIPFEIGPILPCVSIFAVIFPLSPGLIWLELAMTAAHPQDGTNFSIISSLSPAFLTWKTCSMVSPAVTVPKLWVSASNAREGWAYEMAGKRSRNVSSTIFLMDIAYTIFRKKYMLLLPSCFQV